MRNRTKNQVKLAFIRHGETKANQEHRYLGRRTDEGLSEDGRKRLMEYKKRNYYPDAKYLFCSPMKRCLETAEILYPSLCPRMIPEWVEMDFGRFEYKNYEQLKEDTEYQSWIDSQGNLPFPGGESREQFLRRCEIGFVKMCEEFRQKLEVCEREQKTYGQKVSEYCRGSADAVLIIHGGTIMSLLSRHHGKDYFDYQIPNGRGYVCKMRGWGERAQIVELKQI